MTLNTSARVRATLSATALIAALAMCGSARAADDGSGSLWEATKGILMFGDPSADEKPVIDYRERAPLVLPKNAAGLPSPVQRTRGANWPNDPDVAARAAAAAEARAPRQMESNRGPNVTPHELAAGRGNGGQIDSMSEDGRRNFGGGGGCVWMNPDKLRSIGVKREAATRLPVGSEPDRAYLTQPPKGYRKVTQQTGGGVVKPVDNDDAPKALDFIRNPFGKKDDDE